MLLPGIAYATHLQPSWQHRQAFRPLLWKGLDLQQFYLGGNATIATQEVSASRRRTETFRIPQVFFAVDGRSRRFYGCLAPHTLSDLLPTTANFSDDDILSN